MLPPIATETDAANLGFTVTLPALNRASTRVRGHLRQDVTVGTSTITARGLQIRLPQRPVIAVTAVTSGGAAVPFTLSGSLLEVDTLDPVEITYTHGFTTVPDGLVELVCQLATRLDAPSNPAIAAGVQQATAGPFQVGYGWDAWKAQAGLTAGEKELLRRYWPDLPRTVPLGRP